MRIHRGHLFWGIFFVLLGGIPLAERAGLIDGEQLGLVGRLWPLALIAIGVAIIVARSGVALIGTMATALVLGGLAGSALAYGNGFAFDLADCAGAGRGELERTAQSGVFAGPANLDLELNCGTLDLQAGEITSSLQGWSLAAQHRGAAPEVTDSGIGLSVRSPESSVRRQEWTLFVPGSQLRTVDISANAASAVVDLSGTSLDSLSLQLNAGDARVVATNAAIASTTIEGNATRARLILGSGTVAIEMNASAVDVCAPADAELSITVKDGFALVTNLEDRGFSRVGDTWRRAGTGGEALDVQVEGNASSFTLDPEDGCV